MSTEAKENNEAGDADQTSTKDREVYTVDRRRPHRMENASPELIALMRAPAKAAAEPDAVVVTDSTDDLGPAKGILLSCVLAALIWAAIGGGLWLLLW